MLNINSLEEVQTVNSRTNYDIRFSAKTGKFTLGSDVYRNWDINNNGFKLMRTPDGEPVLKVVPNEEAKVHAGRSDADQKGKTFTAHGLAAMLGLEEGEEDAEYTLESHEEDEQIYLSFTRMGEENTEEEETSIVADNSDDIEADEPVSPGGAMEENSWN